MVAAFFSNSKPITDPYIFIIKAFRSPLSNGSLRAVPPFSLKSGKTSCCGSLLIWTSDFWILIRFSNRLSHRPSRQNIKIFICNYYKINYLGTYDAYSSNSTKTCKRLIIIGGQGGGQGGGGGSGRGWGSYFQGFSIFIPI